jgi:multidrug efflux pump subunit AcrA (membrane-fusion protein)
VPDAGATRTVSREIALGPARDNGWIEVVSGLAAGDRVVLDDAVPEHHRISPVETPKEEAP